MAIHHSNNTRLKGMDLPHLKVTGLLNHKAMDNHPHRATRMQTTEPYAILLTNLEAGRKVIQAIHLRKEDLHHNQAMVVMALHRPSSHQDRIVEGISRYTGHFC